MEQGDEGQGGLGHDELGQGELGHDEQGQRGGLRGSKEQGGLGHDGLGHDELEHDVQGHGELGGQEVGGQEERGGGHRKLIDAYQCFSCHRGHGCGVRQYYAEGQLQQRQRRQGGKKPEKKRFRLLLRG